MEFFLIALNLQLYPNIQRSPRTQKEKQKGLKLP